MRTLEVRLDWGVEQSVVGTLAEEERRIYFEYDAAFLKSALPISPFKLPAKAGLVEHVDREFGRLFGAFDDSLPDSWGLLLMDREFKRQGLAIAGISPLDRLAYIGTRGMGALTYHPADPDAESGPLDAPWTSRVKRSVPATATCCASPSCATWMPALRRRSSRRCVARWRSGRGSRAAPACQRKPHSRSGGF